MLDLIVTVFVPALITLLVIIDPVGLVPIFASLTKGSSVAHRHSMALRGSLTATVILVLAFFFGDTLLSVFGITIPAFRIAGGILLFVTAFEMIFELPVKRRRQTTDTLPLDHPETEDDISVVPLAIPLISGPGAITTVILLASTYQDNYVAQGTVVVALLLTMLVTYGLFLAAAPVMRVLGDTLGTVITRLLGVVLAALAIQFIIDGVRASFGL